MTMENGKPFVPPNLTKRPKSLWKTPWCIRCGDTVEHWLYHQAGHIDGTPLIILNCHGETHTFGSTRRYAKAFREEVTSRFASGNERLELNPDGTYNGPAEQAAKASAVHTDNRKISEPDLGDI